MWTSHHKGFLRGPRFEKYRFSEDGSELSGRPFATMSAVAIQGSIPVPLFISYFFLSIVYPFSISLRNFLKQSFFSIALLFFTSINVSINANFGFIMVIQILNWFLPLHKKSNKTIYFYLFTFPCPQIGTKKNLTLTISIFPGNKP